MIQLETERLLIRPLEFNDADFIIELLNDPSFIRNIGDRNVHDPEAARGYIQRAAMASYEANGFGLAAVTLKSTGEVMGISGLIRRPTLEDVDLGYAFLPRYWGKGYAVEAGHACIEDGWSRLRLKRIVAIVDPANEASVRVLEKLGFIYEKMVRLSADDIELKFFGISKPS